MRGLESALPLALPVAELLRGTEIWRLKNVGPLRTSSTGMASTLSKRWGCKALKAVTYSVSLAGNCRLLMLTVLKRMAAPYANARVWGAWDRWCSWNTFHARRSGSSKRDTTLEKEKKRKDYAFRRQFNEKPSIIPGCPGIERYLVNSSPPHCSSCCL